MKGLHPEYLIFKNILSFVPFFAKNVFTNKSCPKRELKLIDGYKPLRKFIGQIVKLGHPDHERAPGDQAEGENADDSEDDRDEIRTSKELVKQNPNMPKKSFASQYP